MECVLLQSISEAKFRGSFLEKQKSEKKYL